MAHPQSLVVIALPHTLMSMVLRHAHPPYVFLLCPSDEYPMEYKVRPIHCTAKWKHGVKGLVNDDDFSAAAMFHVVKNTVKVDRATGRKILYKKDKKSLAKIINTTQQTGRKKRSTCFDQAQWMLADFMENQEEKIHQKILECATKIFEGLDESKISYTPHNM